MMSKYLIVRSGNPYPYIGEVFPDQGAAVHAAVDFLQGHGSVVDRNYRSHDYFARMFERARLARNSYYWTAVAERQVRESQPDALP